MAKINYNGMELEEVTKPQIFDQPKKCVVWDFGDPARGFVEKYVVAILKDYNRDTMRPIIAYDGTLWNHCAILPEKPAPRIATNRELARWLAQGNGEWCNCIGDSSRAAIEWWYDHGHSETKAKNVFVRKWDDTEWHEPDVEYMSIEEDK